MPKTLSVNILYKDSPISSGIRLILNARTIIIGGTHFIEAKNCVGLQYTLKEHISNFYFVELRNTRTILMMNTSENFVCI